MITSYFWVCKFWCGIWAYRVTLTNFFGIHIRHLRHFHHCCGLQKLHNLIWGAPFHCSVHCCDSTSQPVYILTVSPVSSFTGDCSLIGRQMDTFCNWVAFCSHWWTLGRRRGTTNGGVLAGKGRCGKNPGAGILGGWDRERYACLWNAFNFTL